MARGNNFKVNPKKGGKVGDPKDVAKRVATDDLNPVFCFRYLAKGYKILDLENDDKIAFVVKLQELSELSWKQIRFTHRRAGNGQEKISRSSIKKAIPDGISEGQDFIRIRFNGVKPIIGFRVDQIFHIVWIDPKLDVYNH